MGKQPNIYICDSVYTLFDEVDVDLRAAQEFYDEIPLTNKLPLSALSIHINGMMLADATGWSAGRYLGEGTRSPKKFGLINQKSTFDPILMLYLGTALFKVSDYDLRSTVSQEDIHTYINGTITHELVHHAQAEQTNGGLTALWIEAYKLTLLSLKDELLFTSDKAATSLKGLRKEDASSINGSLLREKSKYLEDPDEIEAKRYEMPDAKILSVLLKPPERISVNAEDITIEQSLLGLRWKDHKKPARLNSLGHQLRTG